MSEPKKTLYIVDGNSLLYRAFFAVPPSFVTSKGVPTNAVFGFAKMIFKTIKGDNPSYMAVVFDAKGPTFRTEMMETYKAHRPKMPDQLVMQRPYVHTFVESLHLPLFEMQGMEADDVIGSLVEKYSAEDLHIVIVTGDKDLMQLVQDGKVSIHDTMKDVIYGRKEVFEKMGVYPEQIIDLLSLMGDASDNIPGVRGIGPKTALKLLAEYKTLEGVYEHIDEIQGSVQGKLQEHKELAFLSYQVATIKKDIPLEITLDHLKLESPDLEKLNELFDELEFTSLKKELAYFGSFDSSLYESEKKVYEKRYSTIEDRGMFDRVIEEIKKKGEFAFDTETTSLDTFDAELVGISLSCSQNIGYYIPLAHKNYDKNLDKAYVLGKLFELFEDENIRKLGHNIKFDMAMLERAREMVSRGERVLPKKKEEQGQMNLF